MEIKTKYNIGDSAWVMYYNKPTKITISSMEVFINSWYGSFKQNYFQTDYFDKDAKGMYNSTIRFKEKELFDTKEELINSLK